MKVRSQAFVASAIALVAGLWATPSAAQVDLNGGWVALQHEDWIERGPGSDPVDYTGIALTDAGRAKGLSYTYAQYAMLERQCLYYTPQYVVWGPQGLRIWSETDPVRGNVVAWKISAAIDRDVVTIWMDGRPHPSENAFYPFSGFTTGRWEGDVLVAKTTHIKAGYLRRNGLGSSDRATVDWRFFRHGNFLTVMVSITDPLYLAEPDVVTRVWALDPNSQASPTPNPCVPVTELPRLEESVEIPHHLPGQNPDVDDLTKWYRIPREAVLGYPETLYPEYRKKLKPADYYPQAECRRYCCGWVALGDIGTSAPGLTCTTNASGKPNFTPLGNPFTPAPPVIEP
ncbi:MAG: hypothetical protein AB7I50_13260 [Vicinamibacterales bacterium]